MWWRLCCWLAWFPLQEAFLTGHTETVVVEEGHTLTLDCVVAKAVPSSLQWLAPSGFTIFLNRHPALRNSRYRLLHHSSSRLAIGLPNVTLQDAGVYKCLHYSDSVRTKEVKVTVLATPLHAVLEHWVTRSKNGEEHVMLRCSTVRSKPPPQISWLFPEGLEILGDNHHKLNSDGQKWNSTSTLRVQAYRRDTTVSCIVRHRGLQGKLVQLFQFEQLVADRDPVTKEVERDRLPPPAPQQPTSPVAVIDDPSTVETDTQKETQTAPHPDMATTDTNPQYVGLVRKKSGILLLTLVSFLILILFIIVQLFIMKLRKAHVIWKKENEIAEYTLESYRTRSSNEETSSQEKNSQTTKPKSCINYVTQLYSEVKSKRKEKSQHSPPAAEQPQVPESIV